MVVQILNTLLNLAFFRFGRVVDTRTEEAREPLQGVLVHVIDCGQVDDCEEEKRGSERHRPVSFTSLIDHFLSDGRLSHADFDIIGDGLGLVEDDDQVISLEDVCDRFVLRQTFQDLVFTIKQVFCRFGVLLHNVIFLLLELRHLESDEKVKHLLLEAERCNGEVENGHLDLSLWLVVRVRKGSCHEESEVLVILDRLVTEFQVTTLVNLLLKDRLKRRIQGFTDVLDQEPSTELDT